jgi:MFS family permease
MRRYRQLWRTSRARAPLAAGLLARLPFSMYGLAILLLVHDRTHSFGDAGLAAGAAAVGYAILNPVQGRLVDRLGQTLPLTVSAAANAASFAALIIAALAAWPVPVLAACAALVGATLPPVASCQRALWRPLLGDPELVEIALTVDAMALDAFLITGPLLVTVLVAVASPVAALAAVAAMVALGTLWFSRLPPSRAWRNTGPPRGRLSGPLASAGIRTLVLTIGLTGVALGTMRVALIAFAGRHGSVDAGGLLYTALGAGSLTGGLLSGAREWKTPLNLRYPLLLGGFALCTLPLAAAGSLPAMGALAVVGGLFLAPVTICEFRLAGMCAPPGTVTEAFAWSITATFAGSAAGNALGGLLVDATGWRTTLLITTGVLTCAALGAWAWRRCLQPPPPELEISRLAPERSEVSGPADEEAIERA